MGLTQGLTVAIVLGACSAQTFGQIYTCTDSKGRRLTMDRPIPECSDREQYELNPSGTVRRTLGPTLTAPERAAADEKARKLQEERNRQADDKKRERALLARYPNRAAHDKERAAALEQVDGVLKTAEVRAIELQTQRRKLDGEAAFYGADPTKYPPSLKRQLEENEQNLAAQKRFVANQDEEKKRIHARFDDELDQLRRLWALAGTPVQALK